MKKVVLSGIQPCGNLHIGNYIGALSQWVGMQETYDCITMIADLHALTLPQDPKPLPEKIKETVAVFLAAGIDPEKSHIFIYDADEVPVGEDQKQHIEITRDIAERFNKMYGETFRLPQPRISKDTARIMSLQNPDRKMSKSDNDPLGTINILDSEAEIREKVKKAVTDSGSKIGEQGSAAITNLLTIYAGVKNLTFEEALKLNGGKSCSEFKTDLAEAIVEIGRASC